MEYPAFSNLPFEKALSMGAQPGRTVQELVAGQRAFLVSGQLYLAGQTLPELKPTFELLRPHVLEVVVGSNVFHVTDVLVFQMQDVRGLPLSARLRALRHIALPRGVTPVAQGSNVGEFLDAVVSRGGKGVILKPLYETYGSGMWVRVVRRSRQLVVVTTLHKHSRSASVAQFAGSVLVDRGRVFLGREFDEARVAQVIEVEVSQQSSTGQFIGAEFLGFRHTDQPIHCRIY